MWTIVLITLWLLTDIPSMDNLWLWPLLLIPNVVMIPLDGILLLNVQLAVPQIMIAVAAVLNAAIAVVDIIALVWFSIIWSQCREGHEIEFLCTLPENDKLGVGYIIVVCAFFIGTAGMFFALFMTYKRNHQAAVRTVTNEGFPTSKKSEFHFAQWAHSWITIAMGALCVLIIEASYLAPYSTFVFLWLCHLLWVAPALASYVSLTMPHKDKVFLGVSFVAAVGSMIGPILMGVYYHELCVADPPEEFAGISTCDLGNTATLYFIVVHTLFAALAFLRVGAYGMTLYLGATVAVQRDDLMPLLDAESEAPSNYRPGQVWARSHGQVVTNRGNAASQILSQSTGMWLNV